MHRRKSWSDSGVSEVIGTILILAMTVVLFASIIIWVSTLPTPPASTRVDMDGSLSPIYDDAVAWAGANITIQHRGGESLTSHKTEILLVVERGAAIDSETLRTRGTVSGLPYGIDGPDLDWDAGERWSYTNYSILADDRVSVLVIDFVKSQIVWNEPLRPPLGVYPPLFLEKWLDGDVATAFTRDIPLTGRPFGLYVRLSDPDGDLDAGSVTFELMFGPRGVYQLYDDGTNGDYIADDGIFSRYTTTLVPATGWDRGIVLLRAEDIAGHVADTRLIFQVKQGPEDETGGGGQGPLDLNFQNEFQAWAIYNDTEWDALRWAANETRRFEKGEVVVVVVASQYLKNLALQNDFMLYNPDDVPQRPVVYSDPPYTQNPDSDTIPSTTDAFRFSEYTSGFYVYEYRFSTDSAAYEFDGVQLAYGQYHLEITLRASNVPSPRNQFNTVDGITVTDAGGNAPAYPLLEFFADSGHTQPTNEFRFTDVLYARVRVQDTDAGVTAGDVVISDFIGGIQVWPRPGTAPVSAVTTNGTLYYKFTVDLSTPSPDPWIIGRNSYGFRLKWIQDANEDYALSKQVVIQGPRWRLDVATSMEEWGHPVYSTKWYAFLNENDDLWSLYMIEKYDTSPSQQTPPWGGGSFRQMVLADTDEDGDLDAITGLHTTSGPLSSKVFLYRNLLGNGHLWERQQVVDYGSNQVLAVAAGRLDKDTDVDIVVGLDNGTLYRYMNQGGVWAGLMIVDVPGAITALKVADYDMDGDKDIFVGRSTDNQVTIYLNNGAGTFGSPVSVAVGATVYDLVVADIDGDQDNDLIIARGANVRVYFYTGSGYGGSPETLTTSGNALAVDVGYIDGDPNLDVVAGTSTGNLYWWRNGPWGRTLITTLAGSDQVLSLRCGDVDGDFLDDVVIGSNLGDVRWFRHTSSGLWNDNLIQKVGAKAYDVDIGDVDRGVIIDRSK